MFYVVLCKNNTQNLDVSKIHYTFASKLHKTRKSWKVITYINIPIQR